jgi:SAM-dependent methyltransferase
MINTLSPRSLLIPYNPGDYVLKREFAPIWFCRRLVEYACGVTISRSSINRIKPAFIESIDGDVVEIGGFDNFFKSIYKKGSFQNLDLRPGRFVDIVEDAENMQLVSSDSLSAVICISVLEHTQNPSKVVNEIHRVLKPGGYFLMSNPWMFESHMEPYDYCRFSSSFCELLSENFIVESTDRTNGYFGLLAHFCQRNIVLRLSIGIIFLLLDLLLVQNARWSTQITMVLRKPDNL